MEPLFAVSLNDELQQARESVAKAEEEVLLKITKKVLTDFLSYCMLLVFVLKANWLILFFISCADANRFE